MTNNVQQGRSKTHEKKRKTKSMASKAKKLMGLEESATGKRHNEP
jgi:hypothetical protein